MTYENIDNDHDDILLPLTSTITKQVTKSGAQPLYLLASSLAFDPAHRAAAQDVVEGLLQDMTQTGSQV